MARTPEQMNAAIGDALGAIMQDDGAMLTRWVTVAEVIDTDGDRALWLSCPTDQKSWDTLGMLRFADRMEGTGVEDEP